jgi:hypothetical protein
MANGPVSIQFAPGSYAGIGNGQVTVVTAAQPFTVAANAGQILTLIYGGGAPNGDGGYDLIATITDPNGNALPEGNPVPSGYTATLPSTGTYTIMAGITPMGNMWTGTLSVCVLVVNPPPNI